MFAHYDITKERYLNQGVTYIHALLKLIVTNIDLPIQ